mmetsp:Transcript_107117/g.311020  ORF Transcript_107117/g.311020 Transcript_107117/m.311020 type:complete len:311 (+) Transcript_107117:104-1036(+)
MGRGPQQGLRDRGGRPSGDGVVQANLVHPGLKRQNPGHHPDRQRRLVLQLLAGRDPRAGHLAQDHARVLPQRRARMADGDRRGRAAAAHRRHRGDVGLALVLSLGRGAGRCVGPRADLAVARRLRRRHHTRVRHGERSVHRAGSRGFRAAEGRQDADRLPRPRRGAGRDGFRRRRRDAHGQRLPARGQVVAPRHASERGHHRIRGRADGHRCEPVRVLRPRVPPRVPEALDHVLHLQDLVPCARGLQRARAGRDGCVRASAGARRRHIPYVRGQRPHRAAHRMVPAGMRGDLSRRFAAGRSDGGGHAGRL